MASNVINAFVFTYAALFPIVNPFGSAPVFLNLTRHCSAPARHALARQVALNGFLLLLGSLLIGSHILEFFGLTLPIVRIAGGLVVTAMGWQLLKEGSDTRERKTAALADDSALQDAFYPLTMPLTVGPGSISVAIALGSKRPAGADDLGHLALIGGGAVAGLLAISATIYVAYRFAGKIETLLGQNGTNVLVRLSAFILLCIGIEILWSGYSGLVGTALPR
jgi:multiple antibiotic resistance protein